MDDAENELPGILDGADEPATVEELEEVVRRAGQRRRASLVAGAATLLAVGALGGAMARGPVDDGSAGFATEGQDTPSSRTGNVPATMAVAPMVLGAGFELTPLFRRDANGIAVRAYRVAHPRPPSGDPDCAMADHFVQAQLSNTAAVGTGMGTPAPVGAGGQDVATGGLRVAGVGGFGSAEGEPATFVIVDAGTDIKSVRLKAGGATDSMAPDEGKAVLVVPGTAAGGVVEGLGEGGAVLTSKPLQADNAPPPGCEPSPRCFDPPPPPGASQPQGPDVPPPAAAMDQPCGEHTCASDAPTPPSSYPDGRQPPTTTPPKVADGVEVGPVDRAICHTGGVRSPTTGPAAPPPDEVRPAVPPARPAAPAVTPAPTTTTVPTGGSGPAAPASVSTSAANAAP